MFVFLGTHVPWPMCRSQRTTWGSEDVGGDTWWRVFYPRICLSDPQDLSFKEDHPGEAQDEKQERNGAISEGCGNRPDRGGGGEERSSLGVVYVTILTRTLTRWDAWKLTYFCSKTHTHPDAVNSNQQQGQAQRECKILQNFLR